MSPPLVVITAFYGNKLFQSTFIALLYPDVSNHSHTEPVLIWHSPWAHPAQ